MLAKFNKDEMRKYFHDKKYDKLYTVDGYFKVEPTDRPNIFLVPEYIANLIKRGHSGCFHKDYLTFITPLDIVKERLNVGKV